DLLELPGVVAVDVDADQGERPVLQVLNERPLVGPLDPSAKSVLVPEVEQDDFAPVVAEFESLAVLVLAFDLRRLLADQQVAELEELRSRLLSDRAGKRYLLVAVFFAGSLEQRFDLPGARDAVLPLQFLQVVLAEPALVFPGQFRLLLDLVEPLQ